MAKKNEHKHKPNKTQEQEREKEQEMKHKCNLGKEGAINSRIKWIIQCADNIMHNEKRCN